MSNFLSRLFFGEPKKEVKKPSIVDHWKMQDEIWKAGAPMRQQMEDMKVDNWVRMEAWRLFEEEQAIIRRDGGIYLYGIFVPKMYPEPYYVHDRETAKYGNGLGISDAVKQRVDELKAKYKHHEMH